VPSEVLEEARGANDPDGSEPDPCRVAALVRIYANLNDDDDDGPIYGNSAMFASLRPAPISATPPRGADGASGPVYATPRPPGSRASPGSSFQPQDSAAESRSPGSKPGWAKHEPERAGTPPTVRSAPLRGHGRSSESGGAVSPALASGQARQAAAHAQSAAPSSTHMLRPVGTGRNASEREQQASQRSVATLKPHVYGNYTPPAYSNVSVGLPPSSAPTANALATPKPGVYGNYTPPTYGNVADPSSTQRATAAASEEETKGASAGNGAARKPPSRPPPVARGHSRDSQASVTAAEQPTPAGRSDSSGSAEVFVQDTEGVVDGARGAAVTVSPFGVSLRSAGRVASAQPAPAPASSAPKTAMLPPKTSGHASGLVFGGGAGSGASATANASAGAAVKSAPMKPLLAPSAESAHTAQQPAPGQRATTFEANAAATTPLASAATASPRPPTALRPPLPSGPKPPQAAPHCQPEASAPLPSSTATGVVSKPPVARKPVLPNANGSAPTLSQNQPLPSGPAGGARHPISTTKPALKPKPSIPPRPMALQRTPVALAAATDSDEDWD
jgi:hypothetical protein